MLQPSAIQTAYQHVQPYARRTPTIQLETGAFGVPTSLNLKLESLQHTGTFKLRGAINFMRSQDSIPAAGVVAASGGNHGIAVAYAAKLLGHPAEIFVPSISSPVKQARIRELGATVTVAGDVYADALAASQERVATTGALNIGAYQQAEVIAGQGTVALEWAQQEPSLDTVLVAVGGGGLIAGVCGWFAGRVKVVAVEPVTSAALHHARAAGELVDVDVSGVAADSLGAKRIGELAFELTQQYVAESVLVTDDAIVDAQQRLWGEMRFAAEPGGATALAALISGVYQPQEGERVGVLVCGGNVNPGTLG
ncbi:MAG: threonine/serine dehydratase [Chloroflexota bacterium]